MTRLSLIFLVCIGAAFSLRADIPNAIPQQGRIVSNGLNFDGIGQFKFLLFGDEDADHNSGNELAIWSNTATAPVNMNEPSAAVSLFVTKGLYSVWLGDTDTTGMAALPADFDPSDKQLYLRLWFDDGSNGIQQISPDQKIASVPYALLAAKAEFATGAGTAQSVPAGSIGSAQIANGAIQEIDMANDSITQDKLAPGAATGLGVPGEPGTEQVVVKSNGTVLLGDSASTASAAPLLNQVDLDNSLIVPTDLAVQGDFIYALDDGTNSLQIYDAPNPDAVNLRDIDDANLSLPRAVAVEGDFAYVVDDGTDLLQVFNVANPDLIVPLGSIGLGSSPVDVAVQNQIVYVIDDTVGTLQIYDATDANAIVAKGSTTANLMEPNALAVGGDFAYVVDEGTDRLQIFDVSDVNSIITMDFDQTNMSRVKDLAVSGNYAYAVFGQILTPDGLQIFDVSNASAIVPLDSESQNVFIPTRVTVSGDYAYVLNGGTLSTLAAFDISDPNSIVPWVVNSSNIVTGTCLAADASFAYVGDENVGALRVFDISPPVSISGGLSVSGESAFGAITLTDGITFPDGTAQTTSGVQDLSLSGNTLSISQGNNVSLAAFSQIPLLSGDNLSLTGNPTIVSLGQYLRDNGSEPVTGSLTVNNDIIADDHKFPSARTFTHQVSASSFVPDSPSEGYNRGSGLISPSGGDITLFFHASLHLPEGATITKVTGVFFDNNNSERFIDILLRLRYISNTNLSSVTMSEVTGASTTAFSSGRFELDDTTINQAVIDNNNRMYSMDLQADVSSATSATRFYGVRIEYTLDTLLP